MSPGDAEDDNTSSHTIKKHQLDRGVIQEGGVQVEMFSQQSRQNAGEGRGADDHGMSNNFSDDAVQSDQEAYGCEGGEQRVAQTSPAGEQQPRKRSRRRYER